MKASTFQSGGMLVVRLERGEDIVQGVIAAAKEYRIQAGLVGGIGAVSGATLGFFELETKQYHENKYDEPMEVAHLSGNLSLKDGEPYAHLHVTLGRQNGETLSGHLVSANIAVTAEIFIQTLCGTLGRRTSEIGVNLLDI
jgi:hypothetical protein